MTDDQDTSPPSLPEADARSVHVLQVASDLIDDRGIARVSRRDVADAASVSMRAVREVASSRSEMLALVVAALPFPPTSQRMREQAYADDGSPMHTVLSAARDAFGAPASLWDVRELQALALAPFDDELDTVMRARLELRWAAARAVIGQLRGEGAIDPAIDDDAAALHLLSMGAGLALVEGLVPHHIDPQAWISLVSRLLGSLAATDPPGAAYDGATRTWRVRVVAPDSPGATAHVLRIVALMKASVVTLFTSVQADNEQLIDMILRAPDHLDRQQIREALSSASQRILVFPGQPSDADDPVARILDVAATLVERPESAPRAAAQMVMADSWRVEPATSGEDASKEVMRLQWTPDHHVVLRRTGAPFVDVERARASALLRLIDSLSRAPAGAGGFGWVEHLKDGSRVDIRLARPEDDDGVAAMHQRCSEETTYQRYFAPVTEWREDQLHRIAGGHRGATLVAIAPDGSIVGLGNVFPDQPGDTDTAEIAVIVEDAWQGRGLGSRLLEHLVEISKRQGFTHLVALVLATNTGMQRVLERLDIPWTHDTDPELGASVVRMTAPLPE